MRALRLAALCVLLALQPADCQQARGNLQPWMQGLIAVAVFLVLVAIAFAVNKFWCQEKEENIESVVTSRNKKEESVASNGTEGRYSITTADFRSKDAQHAYENVIEYEGKVVTTQM
ncbi:PDZK1-interacting protein 1 [Pelodiscus sinensis]|uniref:PDZK1-interacting protein 1 n=1 Tax=Pelodiscus sinensis TaxID=13735 RepID=UPI0003C4A947|nr:PDZK1-interacting protein 1 [Pelodiscus sinensis]|eukprot:XP_006126503.1 PDZK1-interacting protein 1 [Pelodiscus sinensis]